MKYELVKNRWGRLAHTISSRGVGLETKAAARMLDFVNGRIERRFVSTKHLKAAVRSYMNEITGGTTELSEAFITIPACEVSNHGWSYAVNTIIAKVAVHRGRFYLESAYTDDARTARRAISISESDAKKILERRFNGFMFNGDGVEK